MDVGFRVVVCVVSKCQREPELPRSAKPGNGTLSDNQLALLSVPRPGPAAKLSPTQTTFSTRMRPSIHPRTGTRDRYRHEVNQRWKWNNLQIRLSSLSFFQVELSLPQLGDEFFSEEAPLAEDLNRHERDGVHGHAHAGSQSGRQGRRQGGGSPRQEEVAPIQELPLRSEQPRQVDIQFGGIGKV